ncbi:hypothetical protein QE152_g794 [Popillia japonica]|uniref:Secreted protein n=1 Tax=Popillia japonica TaxID=7064 RepID=A0AAW1NAK3_POPJA
MLAVARWPTLLTVVPGPTQLLWTRCPSPRYDPPRTRCSPIGTMWTDDIEICSIGMTMQPSSSASSAQGAKNSIRPPPVMKFLLKTSSFAPHRNRFGAKNSIRPPPVMKFLLKTSSFAPHRNRFDEIFGRIGYY